ncbi:hypothetical protein [Streptomyces sp. NPDC002134]|uniref:hypothetical protein n=1 Tax=Streptomyces sp. NPDC002134 TaxID=3364632 RepID=UPI00368C4200
MAFSRRLRRPGALQFLCGALASPLVGLFGEGTSLPMAVIMLIAMVAAAPSP